MNKKTFIDSCFMQLVEIFEDAKNHKKDKKKKYRLEGYIHAGKTLGLFSNEEAITLMEEAHYKIFEETIDSRKSRKANLKEALVRGDDDYIDIPAYERNRT
ncbi:MAG: hypothetical protein QMC62_03990 [Alteromonadaceae bacterium]